MNVSIVIPNLNGEKLLENNLPKILEAAREYHDGNVEIIIADDPSTDNSSKVIKAFIGSIKEKNIIGKTISNKNKKEAGFSKNVNRGVSLAAGDILILLNSDVIPHNNFIAPLISCFKDQNVFAVGCLDESVENGKTILRGRGIAKWRQGFLIHSAGNLDKFNSLWASGGSSAFRRSIWNKLKGLDIIYDPFYWEDIDLSYRALKSGFEVLFEPKSIVRHEHEKGVIKNKFKSAQIKKIAYRNQFIFIWKNITNSSLLFSHIFWLPYHFIKAVGRKDWIFFAGFYLALIKLPKIMEAREKAGKLFVLSDKKIIKEHSE